MRLLRLWESKGSKGSEKLETKKFTRRADALLEPETSPGWGWGGGAGLALVFFGVPKGAA